MSLIHRDHIHDSHILGKRTNGSVSSDPHPPTPFPLLKNGLSVRPVDNQGDQFGMLDDFTLPVDQDAFGGYDKKVSLPLFMKMTHRGQHLDGFSEAHIIAQKCPLLLNHILRSKHLIPPECGEKESLVEFK